MLWLLTLLRKKLTTEMPIYCLKSIISTDSNKR